MIAKSVWLAAAIPLVAVTAWVAAQATQPARPTAVAVADVLTIFNSLDEKGAIEEQLKQEKAAKEQEINQLRADVDILAPGSEAHETKQQQLEQKAVEYNAWAAYQTQRLVERLYMKILQAVDQTAQARGYDLVLFKDPPVNFRSTRFDELPRLIQNRKVVWSAESLDITQDVLTMMNSQFQGGGQ